MGCLGKDLLRMEGSTWAWVMGTLRDLVPVLARPGVPHEEFWRGADKRWHFSSRGFAREIRVYPRSVIFKLVFFL